MKMNGSEPLMKCRKRTFFAKPAFHHWALLAMLALERADSIRYLYRHFLSRLSDKSLNTFYHLCSHAKIDYTAFMNVTASMALKMIPKDLVSQPVFLCIDDTMVPKSGKNFEDVSKLFDHAVRVSTSLPFFRLLMLLSG